jgi:hypothetical protein
MMQRREIGLSFNFSYKPRRNVRKLKITHLKQSKSENR